MEFRTKIPLQQEEPKIAHDSSLLLIGSCFVEHIGEKLEYFKFRSLVNPFGILFHPAAIRNFLQKIAVQTVYTDKDIFFDKEVWHCFDAHSKLNHPEKTGMLRRLNKKIKQSFDFLQNASHVVLTLGTAWGYRYRDSGELVANCHKLPQKDFQKTLTEVEEDLLDCVRIIRSVNPSATVVFTVSPVRHLKDGFMENQVSKSKLITAVHNVTGAVEETKYFPAYEIMMDELRDYRFYTRDMLHPNQVAVDYIWQQFTGAWIAPEAASLMKQVERVRKGLAHKPFNKESESHRRFVKDLQENILRLQQQYPHMKFRSD